MPTAAELRTDALALLNMASEQNVDAVLTAALVAKNGGVPLSPNLTTQQLLDASAYVVTQAKSDLHAITVNQWMKFLQNAGGVASIVPGSGITVDNTDPANPVVSAIAGNMSAIDWGSPITVDWNTVFGGNAASLAGGQCFEAQFDLLTGLNAPREEGDMLVMWPTDLSQSEGNGGTHKSKKIPIAFGIRGNTGTYADFRVIFHVMPAPETTDIVPGLRLYDYHHSNTDSDPQTYQYTVVRVA